MIAIPSRFADPESLPLTQLLEKRASQESEFFLGTIIPFVGKPNIYIHTHVYQYYMDIHIEIDR